ncbi:hypothetical protein LCGC14_0989240 [marine sediment metagenome]|uniref:Uncharacterized protein n=1 Tax=marine sediment metagenome TaxID=412755 RepID=A0A0F9QPN4_9ZZZZ
MVKFRYFYRILYLELHIPLKITDLVYILPRESSVDNKNYCIDFIYNYYVRSVIEVKGEIWDKIKSEEFVKQIS